MKKILVVTPYFYPEKGGLENYALRVAQKLQDKYKIFFLSLSAVHDRKFELDKITVYQRKADFVISQTPIKFLFLWEAIKIIKKEKIDLIHAHTPVPFAADMAAIASFLTKRKFMVTYHSRDLIPSAFFHKIIIAIYRFFEKIILYKAKKIVAVSPHIFNNEKFKPFLQKTSVIFPGVDPSLFNFDSQSGSENTIFMVANLNLPYYNCKGLPIMLEALKEIKGMIPDCVLRIAGEKGNCYEIFCDTVKKLDLSKNVIFLGKISSNDIKNEYKKATLVVVPSTTTVEGCPTVLFEAGVMNRPVVGSNIGGIPYIIKDGFNGFLAIPGDYRDLAHKILCILQDKNLAENLGQNARRNVEENYTWEIVAKKYEKIYDILC